MRSLTAGYRGRSVALLAATLAAGATGAAALGQVSGLNLQYEAFFTQVGSAAPTSSSTYQCSAFFSVASGNEGVFSEMELHAPGGATRAMNGSGSFYTTGVYSYGTRGALMAGWPGGAYAFVVVEGDAPGHQYQLNQPSVFGLWPSSIPAFTSESVDAMEGMNPANALTVSVNTFVMDSQANRQLSGIYISRRNPDGTPAQTVWSSLVNSSSPPSPTRTIPAGTLQPNTAYLATWEFANRVEAPPPSPPPGVSFTAVAFDHLTRLAFDTGSACPADLGAAGGVAGSDGLLDNNDFIAFITHFFNADSRADVGVAGGLAGSDGQYDNNDFIAFISLFFAGC